MLVHFSCVNKPHTWQALSYFVDQVVVAEGDRWYHCQNAMDKATSYWNPSAKRNHIIAWWQLPQCFTSHLVSASQSSFAYITWDIEREIVTSQCGLNFMGGISITRNFIYLNSILFLGSTQKPSTITIYCYLNTRIHKHNKNNQCLRITLKNEQFLSWSSPH